MDIHNERFYQNSPLSDDDIRRSIALKKTYNLQEKEIAVKNLYENDSFLAFFVQKTRWENGRVRHQKNLLKSLNKVLYQFNFNELTPEKESYSRYIGSYTNKAVAPIEISYANESLYIAGYGGSKSELVQLSNSLFYAINWNQTFDFSSDDDSTNKVVTQWLDRDPVEYEKDEN